MKTLTFIKALWSPFKMFKLKWYIGKTKIGTPYFYPRKWRNYTEEEAIAAAIEAYVNPKLVKQPYDYWLKSYKRYQKAIPKKIGFDFVTLGWKTKWTSIDYRFEWSPRISFVFFGYQIAVLFIAPHENHYWECWLYYENNTDKSKSKKERIEQCKKEFPQTWISYDGDTKKIIDYYDLILKKKYLWTQQ